MVEVNVRRHDRKAFVDPFLNISLVEGSVRAVRSEEFGMSSELSDGLWRWGVEGEKVSKKVT